MVPGFHLRSISYSTILLLILLLDFSLACLPSLGNLPPPVVHTECLDKKIACQMGYFCGPYGCTKLRRRTLGTKTEKSELESSSNHPSTRQTRPSVNIDDRFQMCCVANLLPDPCFQFCSYSTYNFTSVSRILSDNQGCTTSALPVLHLCASRNLDHTKCCSSSFVPSDCLLFCAPFDRVTKLNPTKLHCLQYISIFRDCFYNSMIDHKYSEEGSFI